MDQLVEFGFPTAWITLVAILLVYWLSTRNYDYWHKKGIPYVKPLPIVGTAWQSALKPLHEAELARYKKYGRIYGHFEGNTPLLSVAEPELLRQIFVKDFHKFTSRRNFSTGDPVVDKMVSVVNGEDWKRIRTIVTPTFTTGKIKKMLHIFRDCSNTLIDNFMSETKQGKPINAKRIYGAYTMDVMACSAFSTKIKNHEDPDNDFVKTARDCFSRNFSWRLILFLLAPRIMNKLGVNSGFFRVGIFLPSAMNFFKTAALNIICERKKIGKARNDFLQMLMNKVVELSAENEACNTEREEMPKNVGENEISHPIFKSVVTKQMSMDELIAQCVTFFVAGYETTASTLSYVTYTLALYPQVQEKVRQEIGAVLEASKGEITYDVLQSMKYLDMVILETLRLYPPVVRLERVADTDCVLGDTGITIPKGMIITVPNYSMHRDPEFFPDPEKFDPERFSSEEKDIRDSYTYLPFGVGPRNCIGMRFALMEVKVCLIQVLSRFTIKRCPQTKVPLEYFTGQGLLQPKSIIVQLEERQDFASCSV